MSSSKDWDKAVSRARDKKPEAANAAAPVDPSALVKPNTDTDLVTGFDQLPSALDFVEQITQESIADLASQLRSGELEMGEQWVALQPGQQIQGELLKSGTTKLASMQDPGVMVDVTTWHFKRDVPVPGGGTMPIRFSMVGAHQMNRQLPDYIGRAVTISKIGFQRSKQGRMVGIYQIFAGAVSKAFTNAIDATATEKQ